MLPLIQTKHLPVPQDNEPIPITSSSSSSPPPESVAERMREVQDKCLYRPSIPRGCKKHRTEPLWIKRSTYSNAKNLAPSTKAASNGTEIQHELIRQHAHMRIQIFYMCGLAMKGLGIRSNGSPRDIQVLISNARKQCGQGTEGRHAAHSNTAAGAYDNLKQLMIEEIQNEQFITPLKRNFLLGKKFSEVDLACLLELSIDEYEFQKFFHSVWHTQGRGPESSFENTLIDFNSQATIELDRDFNLGCDKRLEAYIRPKVCDLYEKIMKNELTPELATAEYHRLIKDHFEGAIPCIKQKLSDLKTYQANLEILNTHQPVPESISEWLSLIEETKALKKKLKESLHPGVGSVLFKKVGSLFQKGKNLNSDDLIFAVKSNIKTNFDSIVQQIAKSKEYLEKQLEFAMDSSEGTELPPLDLLKSMSGDEAAMREPLSPHKGKRSHIQPTDQGIERKKSLKRSLSTMLEEENINPN